MLTSSQIKRVSFELRRTLISLTADAPCVYVRMRFDAVVFSQIPQDALTALMDRFTQIKRVPFQWHNQTWQSLDRFTKIMSGITNSGRVWTDS